MPRIQKWDQIGKHVLSECGEGSLGTRGGGGAYITYPRVRFYENWSKLGSITHLGPGKSFILCEACNQGLQQNVLFFPSEYASEIIRTA